MRPPAAVPGTRFRVALAFGALALALPAARAHAYSYASPFAPGCHEAITLAALRRVRQELDAAAPLPTPAADRLWIDDLPLDLPADARELGAAALVLGVRDNDVKGKHGLDAAELAFVHGDPDAQREHCLRGPEHDEPGGSAAALEVCKAYIRERVRAALDGGLDARGHPDANARVDVDVYLTFAGATRVPLPRVHLQLGRALHALQDSFAHAVRSADGMRVRVLLNWIDHVHERHVEARDGPVHRAALDHCEQLDPVRQVRLQRALDASAALLRAALDPALAPDERLEQTDAVLEEYLGFEPGCVAANRFCDAPELEHPIDDFGCSAAPRATDPRGVALPSLLFALLVLWLRRLRAGASVLAAAIALSAAAFAAPTSALARPQEIGAPKRRGWVADLALASALSASIDETGAAAALGGRYRISERLLVGLDAEWNPWLSFETSRMRAGTFNGYATLVWRTPIARELALRVTGHLGASLLLFDLYGAPKHSLGPYLGLSLLGLELALGSRARLILEPADVAVAVPHVTGIPLVRRQYRATVGFELWF